MAKLQFLGLFAAVLLATDAVLAQNAAIQVFRAPTANTAPALPNWVGPLTGKLIDTACYRKSYIAKSKKCGAGYNFDKVATCWAQCPIEYPVECGMECIPQNKDCAKEILNKVTSVATVALNAATSGVFGQLTTASKAIHTGVKCGQQLYNTVTKVVGYIEEVESKAKVDTTKEQLIFRLSNSDFAVYDLPVAVATCMRLPAPKGLDQVKEVMEVVRKLIEQIVNKKASGFNLLNTKNFLSFTAAVPTISTTVKALSPTDTNKLKGLIGSGSKCGAEVKSVIDKITAAVQKQKKAAPTTTVDVIKFTTLNSDLVRKDVPAAIKSCVSATNFKSRDDILKAVHEIVDQVISASSQNGNPVSIDKYAITIANMGLDAIAMFDPTGIAAMAAKFVQPICGPTAYIGDIDDGPAEQALGLNTIEKAFRNTAGSWVKQGSGMLSLAFNSVDDKDVTVNIMSGGQKKYEVKVGKGKTVSWSKPLSEFAGKTLYLDRSRPGFFGIPGTGGGSMLAWVPNDHDGQLDLTVKINPTSFSDKALRH